MKTAPAFQCYASNIIADKRYRLMSPDERFVWVSVYLECWPNRAVPADPVELAKYLGYPVEDVKTGLTERVLSFFSKVKGELICPELEEYRATLKVRNLKKSEGGKEGAKRKRDIASVGIGNAEGTPVGTPRGIPEGSLIQSKPNQSNQTQSLEKEVTQDPWITAYESADAMAGDYARASGRE
jgi:hypothetical protein